MTTILSRSRILGWLRHPPAFKDAALMAYEGTVGYQPQMAWWAEQMVCVA